MTAETSLKSRKGIFFGWYTVMCGFIMCLWGYGAWFYGMSALFKPIAEEFKWTRTQMSLAFSMRSVEGGLEGPFGGYLTDKYGPRAVSIVSVIIATIGLFLLPIAMEYWQFLLLWGFVVSLGYNLGLYDTMYTAVANWFIKKRALALSILTIGGGLGGPVVVPFMTWVIINYDWRVAVNAMGLVTLVIGLPLVWFFVRTHRPEYYGMFPDGETPISAVEVKSVGSKEVVEERDFTVSQALRTSAFWLTLTASILIGGTLTMVTMHIIPFLTDTGVDPLFAAGVLGLMTTVSLPGRLLIAWIGDHWDYRLALILCHLLQVFGLLVLMVGGNMFQVYLFTILFGIGYGGRLAIYPALRGQYFGRKAYATIAGIGTLFGSITGVGYPVLAGWMYDATGSYTTAFGIVAALTFLSAVCLLFAKRPKPPT